MKRKLKLISAVLITSMILWNTSTVVTYANDIESTKSEYQSLKVDKKSVDYGDIVNISLKAPDDKSRIKSVKICYEAPNGGKRKSIDLRYNKNTGLYEGSILINKYLSDGKWEVSYIELEDSNGSISTIFDSEYLVSGSFNVNMTKREKGVVEIIGNDRYDTAVKLSKSQFVSAETVVIANGKAMADGLTVTPLATYIEAPLLLTETNSIPNNTKTEIKRLKAKYAIIAGGTGVVSDSVINELKGLGITSVKRIGGKDRYETSILIGKYLNENCKIDIDSVFICNGYGEADSLSVSSAAGSDMVPIILVEKDNIQSSTYEWLRKQKLSSAYVIGGTGVVSDAVLNKVDEITSRNTTPRLGGNDRYETNAIIVENLYGKGLKLDGIYFAARRNISDSIFIAKGNVLVDALSAGPLAALNGSPIVLASNDLTNGQKDSLSGIKIKRIFRTGGGISDRTVNSLRGFLEK